MCAGARRIVWSGRNVLCGGNLGIFSMFLKKGFSLLCVFDSCCCVCVVDTVGLYTPFLCPEVVLFFFGQKFSPPLHGLQGRLGKRMCLRNHLRPVFAEEYPGDVLPCSLGLARYCVAHTAPLFKNGTRHLNMKQPVDLLFFTFSRFLRCQHTGLFRLVEHF